MRCAVEPGLGERAAVAGAEHEVPPVAVAGQLDSAKYRCNTCQRELMMYGENTSDAVSISR